eukprot:TRINITY_DN14050_c1_g1_i1.p4 TRINITY_DN14050_c1_g1~~TRINITY_DN14050_c1_g1_i1.p4  ORF type:complete len:113 (-),score=6.23 TRINITY_DN14050_c1_g1_i1:430-768(-)
MICQEISFPFKFFVHARISSMFVIFLHLVCFNELFASTNADVISLFIFNTDEVLLFFKERVGYFTANLGITQFGQKNFVTPKVIAAEICFSSIKKKILIYLQIKATNRCCEI